MIKYLVGALVTLAVIVYGMLQQHKQDATVAPTVLAFVPEAAEGTMPRAGSRRWARMLFHNGLIDAAELNQFYASHPENLSDADR